MERQSLEEGLLSRSPVSETTSISNNIVDGTGMPHGVVVLSTLVAICGSFAFGCTSGYSSPAESGIKRDLHLSVAAYSVFGSILSVGAIIGSSINGMLADLIGRRGTMWLSELFCICGWLAIAFSKDAWLLDVGRFLVGIGAGIIAYVVPVYIAEITPKNIRGGFTQANQFMLTCGFSLMFFIGTVVSWRALALIGFVPCLLQVVGLFFILESPRWLAKIGREKELETTLQHFRGKNVDISKEAAAIRDYTETFERESKAGIFNMFQRRYAYSLLIGVGLMSLQQLGGPNAIGFYANSIFAEADFSSTVGTVSMAIILIPVSGAATLLIDSSGRRPLLLASAIGLCLSCTITALAFCFQGLHCFKKVTPMLVYVGLMGFNVASPLGMAGIPSVIMSEIFPINIKGSAGSLVTIVRWFCAFLSTYYFNFMMQWSKSGTFFILAGINASAVLFIAFLVPETKGRTLEEIQASLTYFPE